MSRVAIRKRAAFRSSRLITVRCGACRSRGGLLFTTAISRGLTWDGVTFATMVSGFGTPDDTLSRERQPGYHRASRYSCQTCGRPWPSDDEVTALVLRAEEAGAESAALP